MRYLNKEYCDLCQKADLYFGMRVHKGAAILDEATYIRLKKRKEKAFIKMAHAIYDVDPRFMLETDGSVYISADKFFNDDEISSEDIIVYSMPEEEKERINKLIEDYDLRTPFDIENCIFEFNKIQENKIAELSSQLPIEIYTQISDPRVFALGYCTKEVLKQLKKTANESEKKNHKILNEFRIVQKKEIIPEELRKSFGFHDCEVVSMDINEDITICFDNTGGFTSNNKIIFHDANIITQEKKVEAIKGSYWIYEELYKVGNGYEAHMLFFDQSYHEFTLSCKEIMISST